SSTAELAWTSIPPMLTKRCWTREDSEQEPHKTELGFDVFLKLEDSAAQVFFKTLPGGGVEALFKSFHKGWTPLTSVFLKLNSLDGTKGSFDFDSTGADFFLKIEDQVVVDTTFRKSPPVGFLKIELKEVSVSSLT